jgi:hypothetical protein
MQSRKIEAGGPLRSLADALTEAHAAGVLRDDETAQLRTMGLKLHDGRLTGFVMLCEAHTKDPPAWYLPMPNSAAFRAKTALDERLEYPISVLDGARVTFAGDVQLPSGEYLHAIDFIPGAPFHEPSSREQAIVLATLVFLNKLADCWPEVYGDALPGHRVLRSDKIAEVQVKNLKVIHGVVNEVLREPVTLSVMHKALTRAGMQMPRSSRVRRGSLPRI